MRVALVHDWLTGMRGGERVLESLCKLFPEAPLFTLVHRPGSTSPIIENRTIYTSFIDRSPLGKSHYRHYLPLFPLAAELLPVKDFDLVISTSHAVAKSVRAPGAIHWCYIHTPMRYVWDRFDDYFGPEIVGALPSRFFFAPIAWALRQYDRLTSGRVDTYVANSRFVADRVTAFYGRSAEVINPPVEDRFNSIVRGPEDFYLFFSALVPYKKADHAVAACQRLKRKLVVLGSGPELAKVKALADPRWVSFLEKPNDAIVSDHYRRAKALIFPAIEDFGIVPLEALSAGLPVIGPRMGGLLDSQTDHTCQFYSEQSVDSLIDAIQKFETRKFDVAALRNQAARFSERSFREKVSESIRATVQRTRPALLPPLAKVLELNSR